MNVSLFRDVGYDWEALVQKFLPGSQLIWGQGYDLIQIRQSEGDGRYQYSVIPVCTFECIDPDGYCHIVMRCFSCGAFVEGPRCFECRTRLDEWEPELVQVEDWGELEQDNALCGVHNLDPGWCLECGQEFFYFRAIVAHAVETNHTRYRLPGTWDRIS